MRDGFRLSGTPSDAVQGLQDRRFAEDWSNAAFYMILCDADSCGNNLFSYYFDPEGNVVEYTAEAEQITSDDYVPPVRPMIADQWGSRPPEVAP